MNEIQFTSAEKDKNAFIIEENGEPIAEMVVGIADDKMTVYHTEVDDKLKGQGVGRKLIQEMVSYARKHNLKVMPLCTYVLAQFKRNEEAFGDLWIKDDDPE